MIVRNIKKSLAGTEDLALGIGALTQERGTVHRINVFPSSYSYLDMQQYADGDFFRLYGSDVSYTDYRRNPAGTVGIPADVGGVWEPLTSNDKTIGGNTVDGAYLVDDTYLVWHAASSSNYAWSGAFPHTVIAGTDPAAIGSSYVQVSDVTLRHELASDIGFGLVKFKRTALANLVSLESVVSEQAVSVSWFGLQAAMNVGSKSVRVYANNGETYSITSKLTIPDGVKVYGDGDVVITVDLSSADEFAVLGVGSELHNVTFVAANREEAASTLGVAQGYLYDLNANGISMSNDSSCHYVRVIGANKGFVAGEKSNIKLLHCSTLQTGFGAVSFYHCFNVRIFGGDYIQCGGFGGVMLPSCQGFEIIGLHVVNKTGTGINPGGSAVAGYNVERGLVTGCIVEAGDCINFENGCIDVTIQANICTINSELGTSNGVGVGTLSHSGGGPVSNVLISGNTVRSLTGGEGIKFGCLDVAQYIDRVSVTDNTVRGTKIGCYALTSAKSRDCRIAANTFGANTGGIWLSGPHKRLNVSDNSVTTSSGVTISNYYGIFILGALEDSYIGRNTTTGWGVHYRQEAICTNTELHIDLVNANEIDSGGAETFSSSVTPALRPMAELKSYWMRGVTSSFTFTPRAQSGLIMLDANVSYTPASNQSVSLWMYMSSRNGASTGYTDAGISLIKISGLKHDYAAAIADCALIGSNDNNTISISAGGFNVFSIREIEGNI